MSKTNWYFAHDGDVGGPVSVSELRELAASGKLLPSDRVRKEDMDRWVKARAVKGLFAPAAADGDAGFDFFGGGQPLAAATEEPVESFNPAFDFFGGASQPPVPLPARKSNPPRKRPSSPELPSAAGSFQITAPAASPVSYADFNGDVPMAAPVLDEEVSFAADVPMATPVSEVGMTPPVTELSGPEVTLQGDGTAALSGATVVLSLSGGWLVARGGEQETYLRLSRLDVMALRERAGLGLVLSVHASGQTVAVQCDGDIEVARAFVQRVLDATG
jgi:hypothetical protein